MQGAMRRGGRGGRGLPIHGGKLRVWDLPIFRYISLVDMKTSNLQGKHFVSWFFGIPSVRGTSLDLTKCVDTANFRLVARKSPIDYPPEKKNPLFIANKILCLPNPSPSYGSIFPSFHESHDQGKAARSRRSEPSLFPRHRLRLQARSCDCGARAGGREER